jgi:SHS2 domain-containing protein
LPLIPIRTDVESVHALYSETIFLRGERIEELLVQQLNKLVYLYDANGLLFSVFDVISIDDRHLKATIGAEGYDKLRHPIKTTVKGGTYYQFQVFEKDGGWERRIILAL